MARTLTFEDAVKAGMMIGVSVVISSAAAEQKSTTSTTITEEVNANPLLSLFGKYRDEPLWEGFEEALQEIRDEERQLDR